MEATTFVSGRGQLFCENPVTSRNGSTIHECLVTCRPWSDSYIAVSCATSTATTKISKILDGQKKYDALNRDQLQTRTVLSVGRSVRLITVGRTTKAVYCVVYFLWTEAVGTRSRASRHER